MNRRNFVMIALAALVTGAAALVYAQHDKESSPASVGAESQAQNDKGSEPQPGSKATATAPEDATKGPPPLAAPQALYDLNALPDPVKRMLEKIIGAAESGDIESMRPVLESNELKPMVSPTDVPDPIAYWKRASADGNGRDVLAAMLNILASGFVRVGEGKDEMYVWPFFAETNLAMLTPQQEVELYRIMSPALAVSMKKGGEYTYYKLGISPDGVWHYFLQE
jgi:hypothetical protein